MGCIIAGIMVFAVVFLVIFLELKTTWHIKGWEDKN